MYRIKFFIPIFLLLMCSFTVSNKNSFYQYECIEVGATSKVKMWSPKKGVKYKFNNALKNAVELILFEGIIGEKCTKQSPLLSSTDSKGKFMKIEEAFFSKNGEFSKFANLVSKETENRGVKKDAMIPVYVISISTQELENYLKEKEIIKPLNKGF